MTIEQKILYQKIDEILWTEWDPIGVNVYEEARDEYHSYVPQIFSLKIHGADAEVIASTLFKIETGRMGLLGDIEHCREIAGKIVGL
ncbi:hypothetical protein [Parapedobacter koreensis]|uniref:Uncharacterized protein n=1 Tax=Parapedobacter koreensis TaxID=332977 RepID=A0A1H7MD33_9SPHI|nr:hypothetical protein [Parapedobacter koreensis]SEL09113.1 hypothetical protein SAMN05421740_103466 [Parapedobacter koreensis]